MKLNKWVVKSVLAFVFGSSNTLMADEKISKPNILWLTFEDTSAYELSIYGNKDIKQPNLEQLAREGLVFSQMSSTGSQCSPARSSLISGHYATRYSADHHRAKVENSPKRLFFPQLLKQAGYFTSNNTKQDYNGIFKDGQLANIWTEFKKGASYNSPNRGENQPFFSVFNAGITHMSRLASFTTESRRDFKQSAGVNSQANPEYLPNLPEITSDYQFHLEGVKDIDDWVKLFIDDLKRKDLFDDTIIFVFSDHGGSSPRGKGFLYQSTSLTVPFVAYVPEKYQHLVPSEKGLTDKLVSFIDLGPTVLSLAGIDTPAEMEGQAFLGEKANHDRKLNFSFRTNQDRHFDPWRGVTNGTYSYIKTYLPRKPIQLRNDFQWGMPANIALDDFAKTDAGKMIKQQWYQPKQSEYLYHLPSDEFEESDLSNNTKHKKKLQEMSDIVSDHIREIADLGFIPVELKQGENFKLWQTGKHDLQKLHELVERVSVADSSDIPMFDEALKHPLPTIRFWGAQGYAELAAEGALKSTPKAIIEASKDPQPVVATIAREALVYLNYPGALDLLLSVEETNQRRSSLETLSYLNPEKLKPELAKIKQYVSNRDYLILSSALGVISATEIANKKQLKKGLKVNKNRRPLSPKPEKI